MVVKIRCMTLDGGFLSSNSYKGISGERYHFHRKTGTPIPNREDAEYFLNSGGNVFKKVNEGGKLVEDTKKALEEVAKEFPPTKKEEQIELEEKDEVEKYTYNEIKAENKLWQVAKIRELGGEDAKIPGLESGRIKLILKLLGGK